MSNPGTEEGHKCVDDDPTTSCTSNPLPVPPASCLLTHLCLTHLEFYSSSFPWIALNLGGFLDESAHVVDVNRVEVTMGRTTQANIEVLLSKLYPTDRLYRCFREGIRSCHNGITQELIDEVLEEYQVVESEESEESEECEECDKLGMWDNDARTKLLGAKVGPFKDGSKYTFFGETGSGGIIC